MKINRITRIKELLEEKQSLTIEFLCEEFNVSKNTIRRDIAELIQMDCVKKVYGGIVRKEALKPETVSHVQEQVNEHKWAVEDPYLEEKLKIAKLAADLIEDEDVIYIDAGTTTALMLPHIEKKKNVTIVTASIRAINAAVKSGRFNVIATGGTLNPPNQAFVGPSVTSCLKRYNISKFFLSTTGISIEAGATSASPLDCEIQQLLVDRPGKNILLLDSSKLDAPSLMSFCELKDIDCMIIDKEPPAKYVSYMKENDIKLIY